MRLGTIVRGLRYGFGPTRFGFMRISGDGPFKCEILPLSTTSFPPSNGYRKWFGRHGDRDILNEIKPLKTIITIKQPITFYFDDNGSLLP